METKSKLGQEPAFPIEYEEYNSTGLLCKRQDFGISKRLYIATAAMQGMLANSLYTDTIAYKNREFFIKLCYNMADEMLKQEQDENN